MHTRNSADIQMARLRMLRDIAVPFARQMEREGRLDFEVFRDPGHTQGCLLGWMATLPAFQADGWSISFAGLPHWQAPDGSCWTGYAAAGEYFGLDESQTIALFGITRPGATSSTRWPMLSNRAKLIDALLSERSRAPA